MNSAIWIGTLAAAALVPLHQRIRARRGWTLHSVYRSFGVPMMTTGPPSHVWTLPAKWRHFSMVTSQALSSRDQVALHTFGGAATGEWFPRSRGRVTTADYLQFLSALTPAQPDARAAGLVDSVERISWPRRRAARRRSRSAISGWSPRAWLTPWRGWRGRGFKPRCCMCLLWKKLHRSSRSWPGRASSKDPNRSSDGKWSGTAFNSTSANLSATARTRTRRSAATLDGISVYRVTRRLKAPCWRCAHSSAGWYRKERQILCCR